MIMCFTYHNYSILKMVLKINLI